MKSFNSNILMQILLIKCQGNLIWVYVASKVQQFLLSKFWNSYILEGSLVW